MSLTTRWRDNQADSIEDVQKKMLSPIPDDERTNSVYWRNISCKEAFDEIASVTLNGTDIRFTALNYKYDKCYVQENLEDDRVTQKNGLIIIYQLNSEIYYIIDQKSSAKKFIRKILSYTGKNEIDRVSFCFSGDFFVWLINKLYSTEVEIVNSKCDERRYLYINEIKGIRGDTEDYLTKVSANGESVMNVISTLSFLIESKNLDQIILSISYTGHECICMKIQKNTLEIEKPYNGEYINEGNQQLFTKLYLLLYLEILPLLEQEYRTAREKKDWSQELYVQFLIKLKEDITKKIDTKISNLK